MFTTRILRRCIFRHVFSNAIFREELSIRFTPFWNGFRDCSHNESISPGLGDAKLEEAFREKLQNIRFSKKASEVVHLFWFLASENEAFEKFEAFKEVCDLAAIVSRDLKPSEITLIFRVCLLKMVKPHKALLQNIAESLIDSNDLSAFPVTSLVKILFFISKRHRPEYGSFHESLEYKTFFPRETEFVKFVLEELIREERLEKIKATEVACLFYSAAVLGFRTTRIMQHLAIHLIEKRLGDLSSEEIAHLAYASVKVQFEHSGLLEKLLEAFSKNIKTAKDLNSIGVVLYSLHLKNMKVPVPILEVCNQLQSSHLAQLRNPELSCLVYSLGKRSIRNEPLLKLLSKEIQKPERLESFEGEQLLCCFMAILNLEYKEDTSLISKLSREVLIGKDPKSGQERISGFSTLELCGIFHAWSRIRLHKDWAYKILLKEIIKYDRLWDHNPDSIAIILHAMGLTQTYSSEAIEFLRSEWLSPSKLIRFGDQQLAMAIIGLSRIPFEDRTILVQPVVEEMTLSCRLQRCSNISLASVLHSLAFIQYKDQTAIRALFQAAIDPSRRSTMSERCLSLVIYSLGKLKSWKERLPFCFPIMREVLFASRLARMDNQALSNILWGLHHLDYPYAEDAKQLVNELIKPHRSERLIEKGCIQICHAVMTLAAVHAQNCDHLLNTISDVLLKNGVQEVSSSGLFFLVTRLAMLNYKNITLYEILIRETLRKHRMHRICPHDWLLMLESMGKLGYESMGSEIILHGFKNFDELSGFNVDDLKRLLKTVSSKQFMKHRKTLQKINDQIEYLMNKDRSSTIIFPVI